MYCNQELDISYVNEFIYPINQNSKDDFQWISMGEVKWGNNENVNSMTENSELMELSVSPHLTEEKINKKIIVIEPSKAIIRPTSSSTKSEKAKIFEITKKSKKKNSTGRKRKNCMGGKHNKFCYDNMTRKLKSRLFAAILSVLNLSIKGIETNNSLNNSEKIYWPFFLKINQDIIKDINVMSNQNLLKSKLKDILSNDICKKVKKYGIDFNRKLIEKLYRENTQTKTISILEKTFFDCLEHFRGTIKYKELEGLEEEYKNTINKFKEDGETKEYIEQFEEFTKKFEIYYEKKIARPLKNNK